MSGFHDMIGHGQTIEHLQNAIRMNKVSHAYILQGEKGSGKKTLANAFAMALQCREGETDGCGHCADCKQAMSHNHPDIIYVNHEKPASIGVDDIREQLVGDIQVRPYSGRYKIYIVPEAEKMTVQAQNALLKTLEEPPAYAVIILLTENASVLLDTILSRCVLLNLRPVPAEQVKKYLMEHLEIPDYQADISVAFAQGNIGRAVALASSEDFNSIKNLALHLAVHVREMDLPELTAEIKEAAAYKLTISEFLDVLAVWYRDVLYFKATQSVDGIIFRDQLQDIRSQASLSSYQGIETILEAIQTARVRLQANVNFELAMELLFLTMKEN